jgi:hypothetical protein
VPLDQPYERLVEHHGTADRRPREHHAVAHRVDLRRVVDDARRVVRECVEHYADARPVVGDVRGPLQGLPAGRREAEQAVLEADAVHDALAERGAALDLDQLELDRGAAAVDDEDLHARRAKRSRISR